MLNLIKKTQLQWMNKMYKKIKQITSCNNKINKF